MITIPPPATPIDPKVQRSQVTEKDPHHEKNEKKKNEEEEIEDEVVISSQVEEQEERKKDAPENPMRGHFDIEA